MSHINCTCACDLTGNQIGDAGATQLANALQRNSTLTKLDLQSKHDMICVVVFIVLCFLILPVLLFHMLVDFS